MNGARTQKPSHMGLWNSRIIRALCGLVLAACSPSHRLPSPTSTAPRHPAPATSDTVTGLDSPDSWPYRPGKLTYEYRAHSVVHSISGDSIPRVDSMQVRAVLTATFSPTTERSVLHADISTDSLSVIRTSTQAVTDTAHLPPQHYSSAIDLRTGTMTAKRSDLSSCPLDSAPQLLTGEEVLPAISVGLLTRRSWADTARYNICRGGIRLELTRIARYRAEPRALSTTAANDTSLRIIRVSDVTLEGTGLQWEQPVRAAGHGTAIDTLVVAPTASGFQSLSGHSQIEINFQSSVRTQRFVQVLSTEIIRR